MTLPTSFDYVAVKGGALEKFFSNLLDNDADLLPDNASNASSCLIGCSQKICQILVQNAEGLQPLGFNSQLLVSFTDSKEWQLISSKAADTAREFLEQTVAKVYNQMLEYSHENKYLIALAALSSHVSLRDCLKNGKLKLGKVVKILSQFDSLAPYADYIKTLVENRSLLGQSAKEVAQVEDLSPDEIAIITTANDLFEKLPPSEFKNRVKTTATKIIATLNQMVNFTKAIELPELATIISEYSLKDSTAQKMIEFVKMVFKQVKAIEQKSQASQASPDSPASRESEALTENSEVSDSADLASMASKISTMTVKEPVQSTPSSASSSAQESLQSNAQVTDTVSIQAVAGTSSTAADALDLAAALGSRAS